MGHILYADFIYIKLYSKTTQTTQYGYSFVNCISAA